MQYNTDTMIHVTTFVEPVGSTGRDKSVTRSYSEGIVNMDQKEWNEAGVNRSLTILTRTRQS